MRRVLKRWTYVLLLAVGVVLFMGCNAAPEGLAGQVDVIRMEQDTRTLTEEIGSRPVGSEAEQATAEWLAQRLRTLGFTEENETLQWQDVMVQGIASQNLTAVCGREKTGLLLVIVAHYDTVAGSPGARDNGASVAAALEAARILGPDCNGLDAQVRILFAAAEETGYHGSAAWANALKEEEKAHCAGVFNMDISVTSDPNAIFTVYTLGARTAEGYCPGNVLEPMDNRVSRAAAAAYRELYGAAEWDNGTRYRSPRHYGESDQVSFDAVGIDAANLCWRRPEGDFDLLPEEYHQPTDTVDALDFDTLEVTARCLMRGMELLAEEVAGA